MIVLATFAGEALGADKRLMAPTSSLSKQEAEGIAELYVMLARGRRAYTTVQDTGSMRPHFDANVVLLLERVDERVQLEVGDIAIRRGPPGTSGPVHRIEAINPRDGSVMFHATSVYRSWRDVPDRNAKGGVWFPRSEVLWRVVAPIYLRRDS